MLPTIRNLFALLVVLTAASASAQMTVVVAGDIPAIMNQAQTMVQWGRQYAQMVEQLKQQEQQYASLNGNRGLGKIANNPELHSYLPDEWASIYNKVQNGSLPGISGAASAISSQEKFSQNATGGQKRYQDTLMANKAMTMQAYSNTRRRLDNINALMYQTNQTQDPKAAADLQNRIAAENALIQNEQIRINLMQQLQQAELKLAEEQRSREFKDSFLK